MPRIRVFCRSPFDAAAISRTCPDMDVRSPLSSCPPAEGPVVLVNFGHELHVELWLQQAHLAGLAPMRATIDTTTLLFAQVDYPWNDRVFAAFVDSNRRRLRNAILAAKPALEAETVDDGLQLFEAERALSMAVDEWEKKAFGDEQGSQPVQDVIAVSVGVGKTHAVVNRLAFGLLYRGRFVLVSVPNHELAKAFVARYRAVAVESSPACIHWWGRTTDGMCQRSDLCAALGDVGLSVRQLACGGEVPTCPLAGTCGYLEQERLVRDLASKPEGLILVVPHAALTLSHTSGPLAAAGRRPDVVIIDEAFWTELVAPVSEVALTALRGQDCETVRGAGRSGDDALVRRCAEGWVAAEASPEHGVSLHRLREEAKNVWAPALPDPERLTVARRLDGCAATSWQ